MLLFQKSIRVKGDTIEWKYQLDNVLSPEFCDHINNKTFYVTKGDSG